MSTSTNEAVDTRISVANDHSDTVSGPPGAALENEPYPIVVPLVPPTVCPFPYSRRLLGCLRTVDQDHFV